MMSLGHVLISHTQLVRLKRKRLPLWMILSWVLVLHIPLDVLPHPEPGVFTGISDKSYMDAWTWAWWWALVDLSVAAAYTLVLAWRLPAYRLAIVATFLVAISPDLLMVWIRKGYPGSDWMGWYEYLHTPILHWWKDRLPVIWSMVLGSAYMFSIWIWSWRHLSQAMATETIERETSPAQIKPEFSLD